MSQEGLRQGFAERLQRPLRAASHFLDLRSQSAQPQTREAERTSPDFSSLKAMTRRRAFWSGLVGAVIAFSVLVFVFGANNLLVSRLLNTDYSADVELKFVVILLLFESGIIFAFAVQDRRRRKLEELLRQSEDRLAFAAKSADLGLWPWDAAADSFWSTEHCNEMLGIPANAQYSMTTMRETVHPDDRALVERALKDGLASGKTFEVEYRANIGQGPTRWLRVRASTLLDGQGKLVGVSGTVLD